MLCAFAVTEYEYIVHKEQMQIQTQIFHAVPHYTTFYLFILKETFQKGSQGIWLNSTVEVYIRPGIHTGTRKKLWEIFHLVHECTAFIHPSLVTAWSGLWWIKLLY